MAINIKEKLQLVKGQSKLESVKIEATLEAVTEKIKESFGEKAIVVSWQFNCIKWGYLQSGEIMFSDDEEWNINLEKIKKVREDPNDYSYILDYCNHSEIDTKYTYPDFNDKRVNHFHIDVTFIFDLETFLVEQYNSFVWGITNNKFGLLDIQGDAE